MCGYENCEMRSGLTGGGSLPNGHRLSEAKDAPKDEGDKDEGENHQTEGHGLLFLPVQGLTLFIAQIGNFVKTGWGAESDLPGS